MVIPCQVFNHNIEKGVDVMEQLAKIYKLTNKNNGFIYIGETTLTIKERIDKHLKCMRDLNDERLLYKDMREIGIEGFDIEIIDTCFERHKFIVEEHWYYYYFDQGLPMYDIKRGAKHSRNTKQRMANMRNNNNFDYSSEQFKAKMSEKTSGENNGMFNKKDDEAVNGRMVVAYDDNNNIVKTFVSVKTALQSLNIKGHVGLNRACKSGEKYKGYYWKKEWINR